MSNPKRYKVETLNCCFDADMVESEDGEYVLHSDYAMLADENEINQKIAWECEAVHDNIKAERDRLAAEVERLKKQIHENGLDVHLAECRANGSEEELIYVRDANARLTAENERLRQHRYTPQEIDSIRADIDKLHAEFNRNLFKKVCAENERLRKAGDELVNDLFSRISMRSETPRTIKNWFAAKEGSDAK